MSSKEKRNYEWFEKRHKTKGLQSAYEQITKAFDTVTWLYRAIRRLSEGDYGESKEYIEYLHKAEEEVDRLRTQVFMGAVERRGAISELRRENLTHASFTIVTENISSKKRSPFIPTTRLIS